VIEHFLGDVADDKYDGFPMAGVRIVSLQNPAYRGHLKLPDNELGARVDSLLSIPSTQELIRPDDVLLGVGDFDVASDGTVLYEGNRVSASVAFQTAQSGEKLPLRIWRDNGEINVSLPMSEYADDRNVGNQYDVLPRYFVYAGLVFTPLSLDYLKTLGRSWRDDANAELTYELYYRRAESPESVRSEPIVLASVLAHPVNANFQITRQALVDRINGIHIDKLEDVVRAFESTTNTYDVIEFVSNHAFETLNRKEAEAARAAILKTYGVPEDRRL
jgi:PDZ domain